MRAESEYVIFHSKPKSLDLVGEWTIRGDL